MSYSLVYQINKSMPNIILPIFTTLIKSLISHENATNCSQMDEHYAGFKKLRTKI